MSTDLFGEPLQPDPTCALKNPQVPLLVAGPRHRTQFVIEFVGPRSIPAATVAPLLQPNWYQALGQPEMFCMAPASQTWQPLTPNTNGSYDSLSLAWKIITPQGYLSSQAARHLLGAAEQYAPALQRKAMPMPPPDDVDQVAKALVKFREALDVGVSLVVLPRKGFFSEHELWVVCARLGLTFSPTGSFDWTAPGHPAPLFSVTPIGSTESFALSAVQLGAVHEGITLGFSLPKCPDPLIALQGMIHAAQVIAGTLDCVIADDSERQLTQRVANEMTDTIKQGIGLMQKANILPGSASALDLF